MHFERIVDKMPKTENIHVTTKTMLCTYMFYVFSFIFSGNTWLKIHEKNTHTRRCNRLRLFRMRREAKFFIIIEKNNWQSVSSIQKFLHGKKPTWSWYWYSFFLNTQKRREHIFIAYKMCTCKKPNASPLEFNLNEATDSRWKLYL